MKTLRITSSDSIQTIRLNRPEARNAFNEEMIAELREAFGSIPDSCRAAILTGEGKAFCAGADANWMRDSIHRSEDENRRDAASMEAMFRSIDECPAPVIGRINGPALGGGMGLIACCDVAISVDTAQFGFTEVRLGIVPAVISPYSLAKIGLAQARRYFLSGELFDAVRAQQIGLIHESVPAMNLDIATDNVISALLRNGPAAVRAAKALTREVSRMDRDRARELTIATIARIRTSPEGQEGLTAFLEKRNPGWMSSL